MKPRKAALVLLAGFAAAAQSSTYTPPAPAQPLPFSHKTHISAGLNCKDCHTMADPGDKAGFPPTSKCMACHVEIKKDSPAIQKLADYNKKQEPIPWKRVYRVPDYVSFSHKSHVTTAKLACETCHGAVRDNQAMRKEKDISMAACMDCHKAKGAPVACDFCHDPQ